MKIEELRKEIDRIDDNILNFLSKRNILVKEIARIKKKEGIVVEDQDRENEIITKMKERAKDSGLDERFVEELFRIILKNSKEEQNETV